MRLIDVQLVITHVIGFLVVLWLLRRFAWNPVLRLLDQRRERIRADLSAAEEQRAAAEGLRREYEVHLGNIDAEARQRIIAAVAEGNKLKTHIKEQALSERDARLARADEEVRLRVAGVREELRKRTVDLALLAAEKAVRERMDEPRQRELIARFIAELEEEAR